MDRLSLGSLNFHFSPQTYIYIYIYHIHINRRTEGLEWRHVGKAFGFDLISPFDSFPLSYSLREFLHLVKLLVFCVRSSSRFSM